MYFFHLEKVLMGVIYFGPIFGSCLIELLKTAFEPQVGQLAKITNFQNKNSNLLQKKFIS